MEFLSATQSNWFLIGWIAWVLGQMMNWIYQFINLIGLPNIGLAVILFTIVVKALLIPMSIKQQKSSRLQAIMQPELKAIQDKYKGTTDRGEMMKQQEEMKAVYAKYGTSMTGGCLQLLIQLPILFALYQVILKLPGYVTRLKALFMRIVGKVPDMEVFTTKLKGAELLASNSAVLEENTAVDLLYSFTPEKWQKFNEIEGFGEYAAEYGNPETIGTMAYEINQATLFLGIDLTRTPWDLVASGTCWWAVFLPILAGVFQWLSSKLATAGQPKKQDDSNPLGGTMNIMNVIFPIISVVFCFMFSGAIGVYWVASSLVQLIIQLIVNQYLNRVDLNEMVRKNVEKMNKKRARRGQAPIKVQDVSKSVQNLEDRKKAEEGQKAAAAAANQASTEYYARTSTAKKGSLAEKAGMVQQYEERQKALKSGKKMPGEPGKDDLVV